MPAAWYDDTMISLHHEMNNDIMNSTDIDFSILLQTPMANAAKVMYTEAMEAGKGDLDFSAVAEMFKK